jgi:hypothetical protein
VRVELLYFDDCPNWRFAEALVNKALRLVNRSDVSVVRRRVETEEQAVQLGFVGSPTVLVDGRDPFSTGGQPVGLVCRVFSGSEGLKGAPSLDQLVEVLS